MPLNSPRSRRTAPAAMGTVFGRMATDTSLGSTATAVSLNCFLRGPPRFGLAAVGGRQLVLWRDHPADGLFTAVTRRTGTALSEAVPLLCFRRSGLQWDARPGEQLNLLAQCVELLPNAEGGSAATPLRAVTPSALLAGAEGFANWRPERLAAFSTFLGIPPPASLTTRRRSSTLQPGELAAAAGLLPPFAGNPAAGPRAASLEPRTRADPSPPASPAPAEPGAGAEGDASRGSSGPLSPPAAAAARGSPCPRASASTTSSLSSPAGEAAPSPEPAAPLMPGSAISLRLRSQAGAAEGSPGSAAAGSPSGTPPARATPEPLRPWGAEAAPPPALSRLQLAATGGSEVLLLRDHPVPGVAAVATSSAADPGALRVTLLLRQPWAPRLRWERQADGTLGLYADCITFQDWQAHSFAAPAEHGPIDLPELLPGAEGFAHWSQQRAECLSRFIGIPPPPPATGEGPALEIPGDLLQAAGLEDAQVAESCGSSAAAAGSGDCSGLLRSATNAEAAECAICFEPLYAAPLSVFVDDSRQRSCAHFFHYSCAADLPAPGESRGPPPCPLCRTSCAAVQRLPDPRQDAARWMELVGREGGMLARADLERVLPCMFNAEDAAIRAALQRLWPLWLAADGGDKGAAAGEGDDHCIAAAEGGPAAELLISWVCAQMPLPPQSPLQQSPPSPQSGGGDDPQGAAQDELAAAFARLDRATGEAEREELQRRIYQLLGDPGVTAAPPRPAHRDPFSAAVAALQVLQAAVGAPDPQPPAGGGVLLRPIARNPLPPPSNAPALPQPPSSSSSSSSSRASGGSAAPQARAVIQLAQVAAEPARAHPRGRPCGCCAVS